MDRGEEVLSALNNEQREAVQYIDGPELIIAGAGAGKTRVITHKIAYLVKQGLNPYNILALTFTNKAAREMQQRTLQLLNEKNLNNLWIGTFHSIATKILRFEITYTPYKPGFTIYDSTDSKNIIKKICKEHHLNEKIYTPALLLNKISKAKNQIILPETYSASQLAKQDNKDHTYDTCNVYLWYQQTLLQNNAMDFDDILLNLFFLLNNNADLLQKYNHAFQYILVDEYQDTNYIQNVLIQQLSRFHKRLCVVGDDAQSIYSFRGADISNILNFMNIYKDAKLFKLQQNYRSTQYIVNAANDLIRHNAHQIQKKVVSQNTQGEKLKILSFNTDKDEGEEIAKQIYQYLQNNNTATDTIAILYRTNAQSRIFENALRQCKITYAIYGTTGFFQRKEIKDVLSYLRFFVNTSDNEALMRIINFPHRGIGDTTVQTLNSIATQNNTNLFSVISQIDKWNCPLSKSTKNKINLFATSCKEMQEKMNEQDAYTFTKSVIEHFGIIEEYKKEEPDPKKNEKIGNIEELLHAIFDFTNDSEEENIDIAHFLQNVSLLTDMDTNTQTTDGHVSLMTIHNAKGLEFDKVFIVGVENNLFPSPFCTTDEEIEEERRLMYVAITRAKKSCTISYACQRFKNGSIMPSTPSRFINELDNNYTERKKTTPFFSFTPIAHSIHLTPLHTTNEQAEKQQIANSVFAHGDRIHHSIFGSGTVEETYLEDGNEKIKILFDKNGTKILLLQYAKLVKEK